jgi:hypothetical protein
MFKNGRDFAIKTLAAYGENEGKRILNHYLDLQIFNTKKSEIQFCKEIFEYLQTKTA